MLNVHLRCTVEICRHGCPEHCSKLPPPPGSHVADVHGQFSDQEPIAVQSQISQKLVRPNSIEETSDGQSEGPEQIQRDKPDIHNMGGQQGPQQQSSEEIQRPILQLNQQVVPPPPPHQRAPQYQPQQQHQQQQGPVLRHPPQQGAEVFPQYPSQIMHPPPPPPPRYFGVGGPPPPPGHGHAAAPPPPPGLGLVPGAPPMHRQPPRKLIPPGLLRQRPDISGFQQHNMPNMRHQLPVTGPPAPVFPSQIYRDEVSKEQPVFHQQHRQAERVQSMIMSPEHKDDDERSNEESVGRQGEPLKSSASEEAERLQEILNEEIRAEPMVGNQDTEEDDEPQQTQQEEQQENKKPTIEELSQVLLRQPSKPMALKGQSLCHTCLPE